MRAKARGFLLFSFAFSSVLSSAKIVISSEISGTKNSEPQFEPIQSSGNITEEYLSPVHGLEKRGATIYDQFPRKNEPKDTGSSPLHFGVLDLGEPEKRNRMGFTGMRGKKEYFADELEFCCKPEQLDVFVKKRTLRDYRELLGGKRAPLAFHGMRGKKSEDYDNEPSKPPSFNPEPVPSNEKYFIDSGLFDEESKMAMDYPDSPKMGDVTDIESFNKRSPYSFQGMRGKKGAIYDFKRAMGFLGMRGKKAPETWYTDSIYKRVPQTSFFGMKGKKGQSGFFGMRGKKSLVTAQANQGANGSLNYKCQGAGVLDHINKEQSVNRYRRGVMWANDGKKTRNAFFGIRGKKSIGEQINEKIFALDA